VNTLAKVWESFQAFHKLSPSTSEFLFLQSKQQQQVWQKATVVYAICMTSVNGISTNVCAAGARVSRPMPSPPVGRTAMQLTIGHGNAALQG
jgi:hypothetical protein